MAKGRIKVLRAIPGSTFLGPILQDFGKKSAGVVTSFSDSLLPICKQLLGDDSQLDIMSFGELVRNLLVLCGEDAMPIAQSGQRYAAISYACTQLGEDSPFQASSRFKGFHEAVASTLDELRHWGIDAEAMGELAASTEPRLASKLKSLAELDRTVVGILSMLGRQQHVDQLQACFDSTLELEGSLDRLLVIVGSEEDPLRVRWLKWLASYGVDITVVFDRHATDAPIFGGALHAIELLGVKPVDMGDGNRLTRNLFAGAEGGGPEIYVSIVSAADPLAESEWALRGCLEEDQLHRVGIYVRDLEGYAPLIESVAKRFQVPIRMARRAPLLTNSFARLTLTALQFCASSDVRTLSPILRSSYLHLSGNQQHGLDERLRNCYIQKSDQWQSLETWVAENPDENEWLRSLLEWRRKAIAGGYRLPEWYGLLREFNREQKLPWVKLENKGGQMDERDRRAMNQMERLLANYVSVDDVTQASTVSLREFVATCERIWTQGDVSIPFAEDGVCVTSDPHVLGDVDRLYVLGMLEGVFPRRRSEDPILTDSERTAISNLRPDHPQLPDSRTKAQAERDEFYRVCTSAKKQIVFSYPLADDQRDNIPAFYLTEIQRILGKVATTDYPRPELAPPIEKCLAAADLKLRQAMDGLREPPQPIELLTDVARDAIRPIPNSAFHPSVLRDALQCPFQYLTRHVLKVRVKRQPTRWSTLRKLPQVTLLLTKQDMVEAERAMIIALDAQLDQLYAEVPDWEMRLLKTGGQRLIRDWLRREACSREQWAKEPGSVKANVSFGTHGVRDVMPGDIRLEGSIAGISRLERYNVAHIYGSAVGNPKDLTDTEKLYFGLHLLAIHESGREGAVEIESMSGKRTLMVLGRGGSEPLASSVAEGLQVIDLAASDDIPTSKMIFYSDVKKALATAMQRIVESRVDATNGEHCDFCDFGELCRRSRSFGEDDSPFGEDQEPEDA